MVFIVAHTLLINHIYFSVSVYFWFNSEPCIAVRKDESQAHKEPSSTLAWGSDTAVKTDLSYHRS